MTPTKTQIADALISNMSRVIQFVADGLREEDWPVPTDYTLRLGVSWPNPRDVRRAVLRASIGERTVLVPVRIDGWAWELRVAFLEVTRDVWARYILEERPDFVTALRKKGG